MAVRASKTRKVRSQVSKPRGVFSVRFSEDELKTLRRAAANVDETLAGLVRQLAVAGVARQGSVFILGSQSDTSARAQLFGEVGRENLWLTS